MKKRNTENINDVLSQFLEQNAKVGSRFNETRLLNSWEDIAGKSIARHTQSIYIKNRILYLKLSSPALKNEISMMKSSLRDQLNKGVGAHVIDSIHLS